MENESEIEETEPVEWKGIRVKAAIEGEYFYFFVSPTHVSGTVPRENDPAQWPTRRVVDAVCEVVSTGLKLLRQRGGGV